MVKIEHLDTFEDTLAGIEDADTKAEFTAMSGVLSIAFSPERAMAMLVIVNMLFKRDYKHLTEFIEDLINMEPQRKDIIGEAIINYCGSEEQIAALQEIHESIKKSAEPAVEAPAE